MQNLKVGQVGLGYWGTRHCEALRKISAVDLAGVYDIDSVRCREASNHTGRRRYSDLDSLLLDVDAVIIAVPSSQHFEVTLKALTAGVSVFVEKPLSTNAGDAEKLVAIADTRGLTLQVGHIERFNPAFLALQGHEVRPHYIEAQRVASFNGRGDDVTVVFDLMIHDLDLVLSLVDSGIEKIQAEGFSMVTPEIDYANAQVWFENGCRASFTASRLAPSPARQMRIYELKRYFNLDFLQRKATMFESALPEGESSGGNAERAMVQQELMRISNEAESMGGARDPLQAQLRHFVNAVVNGVAPIVSGRDGARVVALANRLTEAIAAQKKP